MKEVLNAVEPPQIDFISNTVNAPFVVSMLESRYTKHSRLLNPELSLEIYSRYRV